MIVSSTICNSTETTCIQELASPTVCLFPCFQVTWIIRLAITIPAELTLVSNNLSTLCLPSLFNYPTYCIGESIIEHSILNDIRYSHRINQRAGTCFIVNVQG